MQSLDAMPVVPVCLSEEYRLPKTIPQLDRLRGLAILLVMIYHSEYIAPRVFDGIFRIGWIGVDLFFVLSGFLITGILWDTCGGKNYFARFYGRRILRIWPVYLLVLFFALCIIPVLKWFVGGLLLNIHKEPFEFWVYLLMIQNLFGDRLFQSSLLGVTWSLAIEEQFYLVWPAVIRFLSQRVILPCLLIGFLVSPLLRLWAMHRGFSQTTIYYNPLTHGDGLLCGAMVALWLRLVTPRRKTILLAGLVLLLVGLALFLPLHPPSPTRDYYSPLVFTAVALFSTGLLLAALVSENLGRIPHRVFFMNKTLAFLGFISYSLYLYHNLIFHFTMSDKGIAKLDLWHHPGFTKYLVALFGIVLSILAAWMSRVTLERAALSRKGLFG